MLSGPPDPNYTQSKQAARSFKLAMRMAAYAVALIWAVFLLDQAFDLHLGRFGLRPGNIYGLVGVLTVPLLHGNLQHVFSNSAPLFISLTAALYLYPYAAFRAIPVIWIGSGLLAWVIGRPSLHYGASGLVYGLLAFVFVSGLLRRDMRSISVSLLVAFLYGSMIWGVLPIRPHMSWELHLTGAVMGVLMALVFRKRDRVPPKRYDWEDDDTVPDWYPESSRDKSDDSVR